MTLTIELPTELENALREEAKNVGVEPVDIALESLVLYFAALDSMVQRQGRLNRIQHLLAPTGSGKTMALQQWIAFLHDQRENDQPFQLTISERLQAIQETTQAARELIPDIPYTCDWNREDIYEGDTERVLGILEDKA